MRERALLFGDHKSLVGIVTEPAAGERRADRPAVLLLNAGVLHRAGPNRLYVRLARRLAAAGHLVLRFDASGIGDSRARTDGMPFARSTVREARQAMDLLASSHGARRFVLAGLGSGADNAVRIAGDDARVVGLALLEPYAVPSPGHLVRSYRSRFLSPRSWWRLLSGRSELWSALKRRPAEPPPAPPAEAPAPPADAPEMLVPSEAAYAEQLASLARRNLDLCLVYSAGNPAHYHYRTRFRRALRAARGQGTTRVEVLPRTDHAFTPLDTQEALLRALCDWAAGAGRAAVAPVEHPRAAAAGAGALSGGAGSGTAARVPPA
jgi:hypothetical protein